MGYILQKVGPHIQISCNAKSMKWSKVANTVKQMDGTSCLAAAKPGALLIYRKYFSNQDINRNGGEVAQEVINSLGGFRNSNLYCEAFNETSCNKRWGLARYIQFNKEAAR